MPAAWPSFIGAPTSAPNPRPCWRRRLFGKPTLKPWSIVTEALHDITASAPRACGHRRLPPSKRPDYSAKAAFLCASTSPRPWPTEAVWPPAISPGRSQAAARAKGHNLRDHHLRCCGVSGDSPGLDDKYYHWVGALICIQDACAIALYFGDKRDHSRGFGHQVAGKQQGWTRAVKELGLGR